MLSSCFNLKIVFELMLHCLKKMIIKGLGLPCPICGKVPWLCVCARIGAPGAGQPSVLNSCTSLAFRLHRHPASCEKGLSVRPRPLCRSEPHHVQVICCRPGCSFAPRGVDLFARRVSPSPSERAWLQGAGCGGLLTCVAQDDLLVSFFPSFPQ